MNKCDKRRLLLRSLDWDTAFFTCEELCLVNNGFKKSTLRQSSSRTGTKKDVPARQLSGSDPETLQGKSLRDASQCGQNKLKSIRAPKSGGFNLQGPKLVSSSTSSASCFKSPSNASGGNIEERTFTSQNATRSSVRKIKSSGLQIPSSAVKRSNVKKDLSGEDDGKRVGASCTKIKTSEKIHKRISRNRVNIERKSEKDDKKQDGQCLLQESGKENMCNIDDQVNGLSKKLEVVNLDMELSFRPSDSGVHTKPCSRIPFADSKKMNIRRKTNPQNPKATNSPPSVLSPLSSSNTSPTCSYHKAIIASDFQTPNRDSCRMLKRSPYDTRSTLKKISFSGL